MYRRTTTSAVPLSYYHPHSHFESIHGPLHRPAPCVGRKFPIIVACVSSLLFRILNCPCLWHKLPFRLCHATFPIANQVIRPSRIPSELSVCWSNSIVCQRFAQATPSLACTSDLVVYLSTSPLQRGVRTKQSCPARRVRDSASVASCIEYQIREHDVDFNRRWRNFEQHINWSVIEPSTIMHLSFETPSPACLEMNFR